MPESTIFTVSPSQGLRIWLLDSKSLFFGLDTPGSTTRCRLYFNLPVLVLIVVSWTGVWCSEAWGLKNCLSRTFQKRPRTERNVYNTEGQRTSGQRDKLSGLEDEARLMAKSSIYRTIHCKKRLSIFQSPAGMSLAKLSLAGNNLINNLINNLSIPGPGRVS